MARTAKIPKGGGYEETRRIICMTCEFYDGADCCESSHEGPHAETDFCGCWKESYGFYANCIDISSEEALNEFRRPYLTQEEAKFMLSGCV